MVVAGETGVGKTDFILSQSSFIDLEGRANHRGSAFGKMFTPQPPQIDWENQIIIDWLRCEASSKRPVLIEAESQQIGRIHLPEVLQHAMSKAPRVVLEASMQERTNRVFEDYIAQALDHYRASESEPWQRLEDDILGNLTRIQKRLGGLYYQELCQQLPIAISTLRDDADPSGFKQIIQTLMEHYYDRLYQHHQNQNSDSVVCQGESGKLDKWLRDYPSSTAA